MSKWQFTVKYVCEDCSHSFYQPQFDARINYCPMCASKKIKEVPKQNEEVRS